LIGLWFGLFAGLLYYRAWQFVFRIWPQRLDVLKNAFLWGTSILALTAVIAISGERLRHARRFWSYPPLWTSILIGGTVLDIVLGAATRWYPDLATTFLIASGFIAAIWFLAGVALPLLFAKRRSSSRRSAEPFKKKPELQKVSIEQLLNWLANEEAISSAEEDFFEAEYRARRILNAIRTRRSGDSKRLLQTVVLEGPYGSGKTSVVRLLKAMLELEEPHAYVLVEVSAWGFSSVVVREHVVNAIVEALFAQVDCLAVRDLPRQYAQAVTESGKWFSLLKPSLSELTPAKRLSRLSPVLAACDLHAVVVIEDSDRNDIEFNPQHLQAMLNDFRQIERLSFVLTVGSASLVDFPKVAEHIEVIPGLSQRFALSLVDRIRQYCRDHWANIDPLVNEPE